MVDGCLAALFFVAVDGLLDEVLGVGGGVFLGGRRGRLVFVPAGAEDEAVMSDDPGVLLAVLAGGRVEEHIVDPSALFGNPRQFLSIGLPVDVGQVRHAGVEQLGPGGVDDDLVVFDHEDVPLAVDAVGGVVVAEGGLAALFLIAVDGLLDEVSGVGRFVRLGGGAAGVQQRLVARPQEGGQVGAGGPFREGPSGDGGCLGGGDRAVGPEVAVRITQEPAAGCGRIDVGLLRMARRIGEGVGVDDRGVGGDRLAARPHEGGQVGPGGPFREGAAYDGGYLVGGDGPAGLEGAVLVTLEPAAGGCVFDVGPPLVVGGYVRESGMPGRQGAAAGGGGEGECQQSCREFAFHRWCSFSFSARYCVCENSKPP